MRHKFEHFYLKFNVSFFQTLVIKVGGKLQVSPGVGTSLDTSETDFEEAMDVSDGNSD